MRTNLVRGLVRALSLAGVLLGLASSSQAFTLITFDDPLLKKLSVGGPSDGPSQTSTGPRYSVDDSGCWVVFTSTATNLIAGQGDGNGKSDVFLYDICTTDKVVALISHVAGAPLKAANGTSDQPVISPDGKFVVFRSDADDLITGGAGFGPGLTNVFIWDKDAGGTVTLVSHDHNAGGEKTSGDRPSRNGVISRAAGRPIVAFDSLATNLVASDKNDVSDVFRFDYGSLVIDRVSVPNPGFGAEGNGGSINPVIDASGNCVAFQSLATNLVSDQAGDDSNAAADVFRWSTGTDPATILLSHKAGAPNNGRGAVTGSGASTEVSISDDCQTFAFKSLAKDLMGGQAEKNGGDDIFWAINIGDAVLASHVDGAANVTVEGDGVSDSPILSRDGLWIAYASKATNLAPGQNDGVGTSDVFVYDITKGTNTLASHAAKDPKQAAGGESFNPEISTDGLYVAFASFAKDIDPNQNEQNGARDIFLYNARWNNAVLASRRFASIAITGNSGSIVPALSGNGYAVAFTSRSDNLIADDPETSGLDDVFYFRSLGLVWPYMSVRSTHNQNVLEWITPATNYVSMQLKVASVLNCDSMQFSNVGWTALAAPVPPANSTPSAPFVDPTVYAPGTNHCYGIFILRDGAAVISPTATPASTNVARTLAAAPGPVKWASNVAGMTSLAQVGLGSGNLIAVANDGGVYGIGRGPTGGFWSNGYWPYRTDFKPIQGRPAVFTMSVLGATHTTFVGSQDGRVYAMDADQGARAGGALWYTSPALASTLTLGSIVQPAVSGMFTFFGGVGDHLLVGARPTSGPTKFYALDPATGSVKPPGPFIGAGFSIGAVGTAASVDYARKQVYFASREFTPGTDPSLWCVKLSATGLAGACPWAGDNTLPADISGGPIERNGVVYAGDDSGNVWAFDAVAGTRTWGGFSDPACSGGVKSFVFADRLGSAQDLYYATTTGGLCALTDQGVAGPLVKWTITSANIPGPSAPLLTRIGASAYIYVGSSNGRLYQVDAATGTFTSVVLDSTAIIGAPAFDVRDSMIYVGSDAGSIYAVQAPIP